MLKRNLIGILLLFIIGTNSFSQSWHSLYHPFSKGTVTISDNKFDSDNDRYYITGRYTDTLFFGINDTIVASGFYSTFIASLDKDFNPLWVYNIKGDGLEIKSQLEIDNNNNLIVSGIFTSDNCSFGSDTILSSDGLADFFIAKFDVDGQLMWLNQLGRGESRQGGGTIMSDNNNDIIAVIDYQDSIIVTDNTIDTLLYSGISGSTGSVLMKLSPSGNIYNDDIYNIQTREDNGAAYIYGIHQSNNSYYFSGRFQDSIFFESETYESTNSSYDNFLLKTDNNLNDLWVRRTYGNSDDFPGSTTKDQYGNVYLSGFFNSTDYQADSTESTTSDVIPNNGGRDIFILKYNKNGTLQWGKSYGSSANDWARQVEQREDILYITGYYEGQINFGDDTLEHIGGRDFFVGTFDTDGNKLRAFGLDQQGTDDESGLVLDIAPDNTVYTGGYFKSSSIGIGDTTFNLNGTQDMFLASFRSELAAAFTETQNVSCPGGSDGMLVVKPYFGASPYTYSWSHTDTLDNDTAINLTAGEYTVTVTDAVDSTVVISETLTEPDPIYFNGVMSDTIRCYGDTIADINNTPEGGTAPYDYFWETSDGSGLEATTQDQTNLSAGTYTVTITDDNSCTADTSIIITQPSNIDFSGTSITHITNTQDGAVDLSVSGATPPYSNYNWTGPESFSASTKDISGLTEGGTYAVTLEDDNTCSFDTSVNVIDSTRMNVYFHEDSVQHVSCNGGSDGRAIVTVVEPNGAPSYSWSDNATSINDSLAYDLSADKYYVTVADDDTSITDSVIITQPDPLSIGFSGSSTSQLDCYGDSDGIIDLTRSGGTSPYTYNWETTDGSGLNTTSEDQSGLTAGTYDVTVTDDNGCSTSDSYTIGEPADLTVSVALNEAVSCYNYSDAEAEANPSGGTGSYYYEWNDGANQTTKVADGLSAGSYTVTVTDDNSCTETGNIDISEPDPISISFEEYNDVSCYGYSDGSIDVDAEGGTGDLYYTLTPGSTTNKTGDYSSLSPDVYTVSVTDANNCPEAVSEDTIGEPPQIQLSANITDANDPGSSDGIIDLSVSGGTESGSYDYSWTTTDGTLSNTDQQDQNNVPTGTYNVTVTDDNSCTRDSSYFVNVDNVYVTSTGDWADVVEPDVNVDSSINVIVRSGYEVIVPGTEVDSCNNFILEPTAMLTINTGGDIRVFNNVTMQSDASGAASIIDNGSLTIDGTATVQRYLETNTTTNNWRYISTPVSGQTSDELTQGTKNYLFEYSEPQHKWIEIRHDSVITLVVGKGYAAGQEAERTPEFTGTLNTSDISTGSLSLNEGDVKSGFNLVGNPYPSGLDLGEAGNHPGITWSNLDSTIWFRSDGDFEEYNWASGTAASGSSTDGVAPPMQSFWVRVSSTSGGSLGFSNNARVHEKLSTFYKSHKSEEEILRLKAVRNGFEDFAVVGFYPGAKAHYEGYDSEKMFADNPAYPQIYTVLDEKNLAINGLPTLVDSAIVPLGFKAHKSGTYTLEATNIIEFDNNAEVYLIDKNLNETIDLRTSAFYQFEYSTSESDNPRFLLKFTNKNNATGASSLRNSDINIYSNNKTVYISLKDMMSEHDGNVKIFNILGKKIHEENVKYGERLVEIPLLDESVGYYFVKYLSGEQIVTEKILLK